MRINYIVNYGIEYISTQLLLEWSGITPHKILYTNTKNILEDFDGFIFEYSTHDDVHILIGFNDEIKSQIEENFKDIKCKWVFYGGFHETFIKTLKNNKKNWSDSQKQYISLVVDLFFSQKKKESRILSVLYRTISQDKFYNEFKGGYKTKKQYISIVKPHIIRYSKLSKKIFKYDITPDKNIYFFMTYVTYLDDLTYDYLKKYKNIGIVDINSKKVYFRKYLDSDIDIKSLCNDLCGGNGNEYECSGVFTRKFLELSKTFKKYD